MAEPTGHQTTTVVIADDHTLVREGTSKMLQAQPDIVVLGEAADGAAAVDACVSLHPDVALLDIRMPVLNGIEAARRIREQAPDVVTVVLTAYDEDEYVSAAIKAGASGYLLKTIRSSELIEAVRRARMGEVIFHPAIARKLARLFVKNLDSNAEDHSLTQRE